MRRVARGQSVNEIPVFETLNRLSMEIRTQCNKIQFHFNTENFKFCSDFVDYRQWECRLRSRSNVDKIKHRNKLIKIADTSEEGYDRARQYDANPIVSDSKDEAIILS